MASAGVFNLQINDHPDLNKTYKIDFNKPLKEISNTHDVFIFTRFKPYVPLAFEYQKVRSENTVFNWGSKIQFPIPQYGDLINDIVASVRIDEVKSSEQQVPQIPRNGYDWDNKTKLLAKYKLVNFCGDTIETPTYQNAVSFFDYPGERIFKEVRLIANQNLIEEYNSESIVLFRNQNIGEDKIEGYNRCIGHGDLQVPKLVMRDINLLIPLHFWFCKSLGSSIPLESLPYGQRYIEITIENAENVIQEYPIFIRQISESGENDLMHFKAGKLSANIKNISIYINNIFIMPEILDILLDRKQFYLIRLSRTQIQKVGEISLCWLSNINWPIETLTFGFRPIWNIDKNNINRNQDWHCFTKNIYLDNNEIQEINIEENSTKKLYSINNETYKINLPVVNWVKCGTDGPVFLRNSNTFFESVLNKNQIKQSDNGIMTIDYRYGNFDNPSGYMNLSRLKEFNITWRFDFINKFSPAHLVIYAQCFNFLWVSRGQFILNYTNF